MANSSDTAFEKLVRPHFDRLYRLAWRLTGQKAEAEDLFQELLIKAYGKLDDLVRIDEPGSWLARMMYQPVHRRTAALRAPSHAHGRRGRARRRRSGRPAGHRRSRRNHERRERIYALDAALAKLSDEHRLVVLLHDTEGYKLEEIQVLIDVPIGTVKSRLHRARARLREILTENGTFRSDTSC